MSELARRQARAARDIRRGAAARRRGSTSPDRTEADRELRPSNARKWRACRLDCRNLRPLMRAH